MYDLNQRESIRPCPDLSELEDGTKKNWHTMGEKLVSYVATKFDANQIEYIKECLRGRISIQVHGVFEDHIGACLRTHKLRQIPFSNGQYRLGRLHKNSDKKIFNVERPFFVNTEREDGRALAMLITFPSREYTSQYAELLYSFIKLNLQMIMDGRSTITFHKDQDTETTVEAAFDFSVSEANEIYDYYISSNRLLQFHYPDVMNSFPDWSGLDEALVSSDMIKPGDIVVIGYVDQVKQVLMSEHGFTSITNRGEFLPFGPNNIFGVTVLLSRDEKRRLILLGFRHSFWGRTAAKISRSCIENGAKEIVYVAKAGTRTGPYNPDDILNKHYLSLIGKQYHIWEGSAENPAGEITTINLPDVKNSLSKLFTEDQYSKNKSNNHISVPTVIGEDYIQSQTYGAENPSTIDNEISYIAEEMAKFSAKNTGSEVCLTCIHFITDLVVSRLNLETAAKEIGLDGDDLNLDSKKDFWGEASSKIAMHVGQNGLPNEHSILELPKHDPENHGVFRCFDETNEKKITSEYEFERAQKILQRMEIDGDEVSYLDSLEGLASGANILVCGEAGVGKTVVAESTYNYLNFAYELNRSPFPPYYINFLSFEKEIIATGADPQDIVKRLLSELDDELERTGSKVIIFDGLDPMSPLTLPFKQAMTTNTFSKKRKLCTSIYFTRVYRSSVKELGNTGKILGMDLSPITRFQIGPISEKSGKVSLPTERLAEIASLLSDSEESDFTSVASRIQSWPEFSANLRLLNLVYDEMAQHNNEVISPSEFFSNFLSRYLRGKSDVADIGPIKRKAAARGYRFVVDGELFPIKSQEDVLVKRIATQSTEMLCYLAAEHLDTLIFEDENYDLDRVFPHLINKYSKDLLGQRDQKKSYETLRGLLENTNASLRLKSFLTYLLGRLNGEDIVQRSIELLYRIQRQFALSDSPGQQELIFDRSINISLIYLGETAEDYIGSLSASDVRDQVNRGFHLAYYGDIDYFTDVDMLSIDRFNSAFPRTMSSLISNLSDDGGNSDLANLSIYTLYSLAFSRLEASNTVPKEFLDDLCNFAQNTILERTDLFVEVRRFVENCVTYLSSEANPHVHAFVEVAKLKREPRAGWNDDTSGRKVSDAETVASHVASVLYLAVAYLPETNDILDLAHKGGLDEIYKDYSKESIIRMLIIHDLGEYGIGDIPSFKKTDEDRQNEENYVRRISLLSRLNAGNRLAQYSSSIHESYLEFSEETTINALIANDLDKIECYCQLQVYHKMETETTIPDHDDFSKSLCDGIITKVGLDVLEHFSRTGRV